MQAFNRRQESSQTERIKQEKQRVMRLANQQLLLDQNQIANDINRIIEDEYEE